VSPASYSRTRTHPHAHDASERALQEVRPGAGEDGDQDGEEVGAGEEDRRAQGEAGAGEEDDGEEVGAEKGCPDQGGQGRRARQVVRCVSVRSFRWVFSSTREREGGKGRYGASKRRVVVIRRSRSSASRARRDRIELAKSLMIGLDRSNGYDKIRRVTNERPGGSDDGFDGRDDVGRRRLTRATSTMTSSARDSFRGGRSIERAIDGSIDGMMVGDLHPLGFGLEDRAKWNARRVDWFGCVVCVGCSRRRVLRNSGRGVARRACALSIASTDSS